MIKAVLLAPVHNSLYSRLIAYTLTKEKDVELSAVIVRSLWNLQRIKSEFNRDGARLIKKIYQKLVIGDQRFSEYRGNNLASQARQQGLPFKNIKELTKDLNIPYMVVPDHNHPKSLQFLQKIKPDVILFTGGGLLRQSVLEIPRLGVLNCHTGILPQYRGMDVVEWTAVEGKVDSIGFGITLHFMDNGVDTGPILLKRKISPEPGATFEEIRAELEILMVELMIQGVRGLREGSLVPVPQALKEGRQYFVMHPRVKEVARKRLAAQIKK